MYFKVIRAKGTTLNKEIEQEGRDFAESLIKHAQKEREKELEKALEFRNDIKNEPAQKFIKPLEQKKSVKLRKIR